MRGSLTLTPVTLALVGTNLVVFCAMLWYGTGLWHSDSGVQLAWGASFGPATKDGEWWRLASAMFLHFGLVHLAVNMWALWDAGKLVERLYGPYRFIALYIASGLVGNLVSLIAQADRAVSGGASGAIFGVYAALLVFLWRERRQIHPVEFRWLFGGAAVFMAVTFALGISIAGIDNAAHLGGFVAGALSGVVLARPLSPVSPRPGRGRWLAAAVFALAVTGLTAMVPAPSYRWNEEVQARARIGEFLGDDALLDQRWQRILDSSRKEGASFEELAGRIDSGVTRAYEKNFADLSALNLDPAVPSAATVEILKEYARLRGDAFYELTEALRANDRTRIGEALGKAREAANRARSAAPSAGPAHK